MNATGLIADANVHLLGDVRLQTLARHLDSLDDLIIEAAQLALKGGVTTVFDTWGPRQHLISVRDRVDAGTVTASRIFCAGNIVGFDGPLSPDFLHKVPNVASAGLTERVNSIWVENVGRNLMWLPAERVAEEVRGYIRKGIDFVKYASNEHYPGAFLAFSPAVQCAIVEESHRAGLTAQAHAMSVEGLRLAVEAGCDLIQHANITGPIEIPDDTLELMTKRNVGAVVFPFAQRHLDSFLEKEDSVGRAVFSNVVTNTHRLIQSGASLLMGWDAGVQAEDSFSSECHPSEESVHALGESHFAWLKSMEEYHCSPMRMLQAATRNVAVAFGKGKDLGTLEAGKIADLVILKDDPLKAAENYRHIETVIKDGIIVDRQALPTRPVLSVSRRSSTKQEIAPVRNK